MRVLVGVLALHVGASARQVSTRLRASAPAAAECPRTSAPVAKATPQGLDEASGLALSHAHPGRFYTVVDTPHPNGPHLWMLSPDGAVEEAYTFVLDSSHEFGKTGAGDWEGVTTGPCEAGGETCLFVADTGHNCAREDCPYHRDWYRIMRIPEAQLRAGKTPVSVENLWFQYPHQASYDAEVLLSHPTGALFILTKDNSGQARIFTLDVCEDSTIGGQPDRIVTQVGTVNFPGWLVTGGAIDGRGERLMLRMYKVGGRHEDESNGRLVFWTLPEVPPVQGKACGGRARAAVQAAGRALASALASPGCELPTAHEPQGEGVAFLPGDPPTGYATISEQGAPFHVTLFRSLSLAAFAVLPLAL